MKTAVLLLSLFGMLSVSCVKDKTIEDYKRGKVRENMAMFKSVEGRYTGLVTSKADGSIIGAMQLVFEVQTVSIDPAKGSDPTVGTPVLMGSATFLDQSVSNFSAPNGFYDPDTGAYSSKFAITRASVGGSPGAPPPAEVVNVTGAFGSDSLAGQISAEKYSDAGGNFVLVRDGKPIEELLKASRPQKPGQDELTPQYSFSGSTKLTYQRPVAGFGLGGLAPGERLLRVLVLQPRKGTAEDFLDLISPVKRVLLSFNYSPTLRLTFSDAILDIRKGQITASSSWAIDGRSQFMNIECYGQFTQYLTCNHVTSAGTVAVTKVGYDPSANDPAEPSDDTLSVAKTFIGTGPFHGAQTKQMKMTVTRLSKGRFGRLLDDFFQYGEKLINLTIAFTQDTTMSFTDIKWDSSSGNVDGSMTVGGALSYIAYVQCSDFYFLDTKTPFKCTYWTSRSEPIEISFKPPF